MILRNKTVFSLASAVALCGASHAAAEGKSEYSIPESGLSEALKLFSQQSGISIVFDNRLVVPLDAPPVFGPYQDSVAIGELLEGSGLVHSQIDERTWALTQAQPELAGEPTIVKGKDSGRPDEIIVTASFHAPFREAGKRSLYTLQGDELRLGGALNVAEPIYELPLTVASTSAANTALLLASGGLNLVDLHGLGDVRSLVLVNGRRYVRTSGGNGQVYGVDLNSIPSAFVERIEVVNQGSGAALGSEAVAGAVNIVLRNEFDGILVSAEGGISAAGDAGEYSFSALAGTRLLEGRGGVTFGVSYVSEPSLLADEREWLGQPYGFALDGRESAEPNAVLTRGFGGASAGPQNRVLGAIDNEGSVRLLSGNDAQLISPDGQRFEAYEGRLDQLYDWTDSFSVLPAIERVMGYATADYDFSSAHSAYTEFNFANTVIDTQIAPLPLLPFQGGDLLTGSAVVVSASDPLAPDGLQAVVEAAVGAPVSSLLLSRRFVELGPRRRDIRRRSVQFVLGLKGDLTDKWSYDVSYQFGRNRTLEISEGQVNGSNLRIATDAALCAETSGCEGVNIFAPATITPSQAAFIAGEAERRSIRVREQISLFRLSGPVYEVAGNEAALSIGVEHRRVHLRDKPDDGQNQDNPFAQFLYEKSSGQLVSTEFFGNISLPILNDKMLADKLALGGAYRYMARREGANLSNVSGNIVWAPIKAIEFYAQSFWGGRAPNIVELFSAGPNVNGFFVDPCGLGLDDPVIFENCASDGSLGVEAGFAQTNLLTLARSMGNIKLDNERVQSNMLGVFTDFTELAGGIPGSLSLNASWRWHNVKDRITQFDRSLIIDQCFFSQGFSSAYCGENPATGNAFIQRDPVSNQITVVEIPYINGGEIHISGLDAQFNYDLPIVGFSLADAFSLDVLYTYTHRFREQEAKEKPEEIRLEGLLAYPRHQVNATASLGREVLRTFWTVRRRGSVVSSYAFENPGLRVPAVVYVDAALQWQAPSGMALYAGVENLFNRELPPVTGGEVAFSFGYYDVIGRRFFAGVRADF